MKWWDSLNHTRPAWQTWCSCPLPHKAWSQHTTLTDTFQRPGRCSPWHSDLRNKRQIHIRGNRIFFPSSLPLCYEWNCNIREGQTGANSHKTVNVTVNLMVRIPSILDKLTQIITQNVRDWKFPSVFLVNQGIFSFLLHNTYHKTDVLLYHITVSLIKATHTIKPLSIISDRCITLLPKSKITSR